jgi:hypothetical protein
MRKHVLSVVRSLIPSTIDFRKKVWSDYNKRGVIKTPFLYLIT